jgi:hypothetical protein
MDRTSGIQGMEDPAERHMSRWEHNTKVDHKYI